MEIRFSVPGEPRGKQRPRVVNRGGFSKAYTPKETLAYENMVKWCYEQEAKGYKFPDDAMLDVRILAYYTIPKSVSKKKRQQMVDRVIRPTKKPDCDNVVKLVCDALNALAYHDDAAVVDCQVRKFYSENPRLDVIIKEVSCLE